MGLGVREEGWWWVLRNCLGNLLVEDISSVLFFFEGTSSLLGAVPWEVAQ